MSENIGKYLLIGMIVAVGGVFFSELFSSFFCNGMDTGSALTIGIGLYLCIVIVTCTGLILDRLDKEKTDDCDQSDE